MTVNIDELGPVDWIVVEFPGTKLTGEIAPILKDYVDRGLIKVRYWPPSRPTPGKEPDMPLAARRRRRTVAAVGGAVVVAHGINRRGDRREDRRHDRGDDREDRRDDRGDRRDDRGFR